MIHIFPKRRSSVLWLPDLRRADELLSPFIALPFFCGILFGCVFGLFSESIPARLSSLSFLSETAMSGSFFGALWLSCRYLLYAVLLSASLTGILFLPCLAFARGFLLACAVAACFAARRYFGLADAALYIGIPALLEMPAFLVVSGGGIRFSRRLLSAVGPDPRRSRAEFLWKRRLLVILPLLILALLYRQIVLPLLAQRLLLT